MFPPSTPPPTDTPRPKKKLAPKKPEPTFPWGRIVGWLVIAAGIAGILFLIKIAAPEKHLNCRNDSGTQSSLISFGSCTTD